MTKSARTHRSVTIPSPQRVRLASPPAWIRPQLAKLVEHLLTKAAERLRRSDYYCRRLGLHLSWVADLGGWWDETDFHETRDTCNASRPSPRARAHARETRNWSCCAFHRSLPCGGVAEIASQPSFEPGGGLNGASSQRAIEVCFGCVPYGVKPPM
jgi:hypothetical protein